MPTLILNLLNKEWVKYLLTLIAGVAIGAVFYPTSHLEEKISKKYEEEVKSLKETHLREEQNLKESYAKSSEEFKSYKQESERKVSVLTTQIQTLQSKQKTSYYKLIKPDGTIEVKKFSESEVNESSSTVTSIQEEFKTKIASIETKWEKIHKERVSKMTKDFSQKEETYKHKIEELEKTRTVDTNKKSFGVEGGYNTESQYYLHATGDLFGPVFMGVHTESNKELDKKSIGAGLGIRF